MDNEIRQKALAYLQALINQPLCYGQKYCNTELYCFGFGDQTELISSVNRKTIGCTHFVHVLCWFKIIWKNGETRVCKYYDNTPGENFHSNIQQLLGMKVKRIGLSDKNDLWLDFGDCWVVFATFENAEESWRYFTSNSQDPHLVASDSWLEFVI